jgi:long-chain acyl-CoA synthetase
LSATVAPSLKTDRAMNKLTLADVVRRHAAERGAQHYLHYQDGWTTFDQLHERTSRVAQALIRSGVEKGGRVALLDKNRPECFEVMFAASKCAAAYVPLNWRLAAPEIGDILRDAEPTILFVGDEFADKIAGLAETMPGLKIIALDPHGKTSFECYADWLGQAPAVDPQVPATAEDMVVLMYTSGTTGKPKGAMLSSRSLIGHMEWTARVWSYDAETVQLVPMPLFHIGGTSMALQSIVLGARTVLLAEVNPAQMLQIISDFRVTNMLLVPAIIQYLVDAPSCATTDWSNVRSLIYGAAPISDTLLRKAMQALQCNFIQIYGMTEHCGCVSLLSPEDHDPERRAELLASCGKPLPWVEVAIVDPATLQPLAQGEVGEIWVRSQQLMSGYWRQPEMTAATLTPEGWLRTGDAGYLDQGGYLYIRDRVKDMIISGGENIYPAEIENVLMRHPAIADAAVIGVPHEKWGETPKAIVVRASAQPADEQQIVAFCRTQLAGFKCPTTVEFVDALPRNPSGKILKRELREPYWQGHVRRVS